MNDRRLNDFAIAAFVLGIISFVQIFGMEKAIAAIVFGILALRQIARPDNQERGEGLAAWAIVLGAIYAIIAGIALFSLIKNPELLEQMQQLLKKPMAQ
ncbi:MAG: DUF4190 domain-containing protein [Candidatus Omnitrophica bacterium]|nr:DUF4190 domain-containing protein [Candidatus Omnitrophota bacterium]